MNKDSRAEKCNNGAQQYVCFDCAKKYRTKDQAKCIIPLHNGTCFICDEHKIIGPSRKLFGFHIEPQGE